MSTVVTNCEAECEVEWVGKSIFSEEETKEEYWECWEEDRGVRGVTSQMESKQDMLER